MALRLMAWACSYHGKGGLFWELVILDGKPQKMKTSGHIFNYVLVFASQQMKIMMTAVRLAD